jgi:hypothetical protein
MQINAQRTELIDTTPAQLALIKQSPNIQAKIQKDHEAYLMTMMMMGDDDKTE